MPNLAPHEKTASRENGRATVAWLRLVDTNRSRLDHSIPASQSTRPQGVAGTVRVGILETTFAGEPLRFGFASVDKPDRVRRTVEALLSQSPLPALIVCAGDELIEAESAYLGIPICRIAVPSQMVGQPDWVAPPTASAERALREISGQRDALAPLARTVLGLDIAFEDRRVCEMAAIRGLTTVATLDIPSRSSASQDLTGTAASDLPTDDLATRLMHVLTPQGATATADRHIESPLSWPGELMPFQQEGVRMLLDMDHLLLADDMGLGKTVQTIAALRIRRARGSFDRTLVVAPTSVLDQWRREIAKWAPELTAIIVRGAATDRAWQWRADTDIVLTSYGVLRSDSWRAEVGERFWDVVVADEAQRIKNRNETSDAVKRLQRSRSWALTGTPIENREEELASIMEFVDHDGSVPLKRYHPGAMLLARHRELQLRRRKNDVLDDLPPKLESKLTIDLHPAQRASYDRAERDGIVYLKSLGTEVGIVHVLELITRLKQICNLDPKTGASSKLDDIAERIGELSGRGHKALVFSQYTSATSGVEAAAKHLLDFEPLVLTGATPIPERSALIESFRTQAAHRVMIVSLRAGGVGLNLQQASYVFHLDRWWNPAVERQAEDRAHRIGQTVKVHVVKYACRNTIEERIDDILATKQALFDELVDDVSLDIATRLNRDELLGLFGLR